MASRCTTGRLCNIPHSRRTVTYARLSVCVTWIAISFQAGATLWSKFGRYEPKSAFLFPSYSTFMFFARSPCFRARLGTSHRTHSLSPHSNVSYNAYKPMTCASLRPFCCLRSQSFSRKSQYLHLPTSNIFPMLSPCNAHRHASIAMKCLETFSQS